MQQVRPQFVSIEDRLIFSVPIIEDELEAKHQSDMLGLLDELDTTEINEHDDFVAVTADITPFQAKKVYTDQDDKKLGALLGPINHLLPFKSRTDVVVGLSTIGHLGPGVEIFPSFQTWLQSDGPTVDMLAACSQAMHRIYGLRPRRSVTQWDINVALERTEFSVVAHIDKEDSVVEKTAEVTFRIPFLQTIGSCACLGSSASDRKIFIHEEYAGLYGLEPHNVENLRQTLSMIVGLGKLISYMPRQFDEEALFKDTSWQEQEFPKYRPNS